ncbi:hypothetical protein HIM_10033 [Hirsutella minnesotensis 3608]|uniref:Alpha/beta hydrolase fold-3 domain-containing protein n=1 Tax=Hirsutella minnesotensis 3608 TaxID=1043627 RepID=A0A0F7ZKH8_9HYPO|nr:hypothetical protein HIM_10033 [Hirsutella minnesotensis 3608]
MAGHRFLQYMRLKIFVSLVRAANYLFNTRSHFKPSATCHRKQVRIPSRHLGRYIEGWVYHPRDNTENVDEPRALLINWHGGGFILPNLGMDHYFCERMASGANVVVLDADYRKGPEDPWPAACEDIEDVLRWVANQPRLFDSDRVALSGFSSGANLALVASSELARELNDILNIRAVYAFYPAIDLSIAAEDKTAPQPIRPLSVTAQRLFVDSYVPNLEDRKLPKISPMYIEPTSFPPHVFLVACSGDILAPETKAFGERLSRARLRVELVEVDEAAHGFDKTVMGRDFKPRERDRVYSKVIDSLRNIM